MVQSQANQFLRKPIKYILRMIHWYLLILALFGCSSLASEWTCRLPHHAPSCSPPSPPPQAAARRAGRAARGAGVLALLGGGQPRAGTQTFRTDLSLLETPSFPVFLLFCKVGISATLEGKNKTRESHRTRRFVYCPLFSYGLSQELSLN